MGLSKGKQMFKAGACMAAILFVFMIGAAIGKMEVKAATLPEQFFDGSWYYFKHHKENPEIAAMRDDMAGLKKHYYEKGITLGYSPCQAFDPKEYLKLNPELTSNSYVNSNEGAYQHFVTYVLLGTERRKTSVFFDVDYYAKALESVHPGVSNGDLFYHYCTWGARNGALGSDSREAKAFSRLYNFTAYMKYNADVNAVFSKHEDGGLSGAYRNFLVFDTADVPAERGRRSNDYFDMKYYAQKIGGNCEYAFWYYINYGYQGDDDDTIQRYTITYDANGGSGAPAQQKKVPGIEVNLSGSKPVRTGYTFQGWAESSDAAAADSNYAPGSAYAADADLALYAVWKLDTYKISYDLNGGTSKAIPEQTKTHDKSIALSTEIPMRPNYGFAGWGISAADTTAAYMPGESYTANASVTLYAIWKADQYMVSYDANGGTDAPLEQIKPLNTTLTLSSTKPVREGYDFMGWGTSADAEEVAYLPGSIYAENASMHLFAVWRIKTNTVKYDLNGGFCSEDMPEQIKVYGEALTLSFRMPTRDGYGFAGWATEKNAQTAAFYPGDLYREESGATLYAIWKKDQYRVIYLAGTDDTVTGLPEHMERSAGEEVQISSETPVRKGYTFQGWKRIQEDGSSEYFAPGDVYHEDASLILYADWDIEKYPVTYYNIDETGNYNQWRTQTKPYGEDITLLEEEPASARTGFEFMGWATGREGTSAVYHAGDAYSENKSMDLYAVWELKTYTVSYDSNGGASMLPDQEKRHGEPLKLALTEPYCLGYIFCGWSVHADSEEADYQPGESYTADADLKLYAVWKKLTYNIAYNANGGSFADGQPDGKKEWGKSIAITDKIPKRSGYEFLGWSEDSNAHTADWQPGSLYTTDRDVTFYAVWKQNAAGSNSGNNGNQSGSKPGDNGNQPGNADQTENPGKPPAGSSKAAQTIQAPKGSYTVAYGTKPFSLKAKASGGGKLTYTSSNPKAVKVSSTGKITIKNYGKATITIKAAETAGYKAASRNITVKVIPKKASLKKASASGSRRAAISWKKDKTVTGYELYLSLKKNFKSETFKRTYKAKQTNVTLTGLKKGKTYFIKIRSYKKIGKQNYYSQYSKVKKVKIK